MVIFAHNHPSGVTKPSRADESITIALKQALALVDVKVLDHLVVAGNDVTSLVERGGAGLLYLRQKDGGQRRADDIYHRRESDRTEAASPMCAIANPE